MSRLIKISERSALSTTACLSLDIGYRDSVMDVHFDILLLNDGSGKLVAYLNQCPHTGVNLNWQPNQCFDQEQRYLACSLHGALFQPEDGFCVYGPCRGQSLVSVALVLDGDSILIDVDALPMDKLSSK